MKKKAPTLSDLISLKILNMPLKLIITSSTILLIMCLAGVSLGSEGINNSLMNLAHDIDVFEFRKGVA